MARLGTARQGPVLQADVMEIVSSLVSGIPKGSGSGLSNTLHAQFVAWVEARKQQESLMIEDYEHKMRISREPSVLANPATSHTSSAISHSTGLPGSQKSAVFIGSTRSKIRSARAKIKDVLFGSGKMPFDAEPTQEALAKFAQTAEEILTYQLRAMRWPKTIGAGVDDMATYGTAFIGGPFAKEEIFDIVSSGPDGLGGQSIRYQAPYYERISPMDAYPDPEADSIEDGMGFYWASRKHPSFIRGLIGKPGYSDDMLRSALTQKMSGTTSEGSDRTRDVRANLYRHSKDGRIWFLRYFGLVSARQLAEWMGRESAEISQIDDEDQVEAIIQIAGGYVVKADLNPYHMQRRPIYRCAYEDEPGEMWGTGVARNNRDNQNIINASFRLYLEGKGMSLLGMFGIDRSKFDVREDFRMFPGKKFNFKPNLTPDERKEAITQIMFKDVTAGWENAIELSEHFSDDDTGVTKYNQGSDSQSLNKTATGISMIMGAALLPQKEVIGNIDDCWIESQINDLMQWCLDFLDPKTVEAQLGSEAALVWDKIREYGKLSFVTLKPVGSTTFLMREALVQKLSGFMEVVLNNPEAAKRVDVSELLEQVWAAAEIGKESPILTDDEIMKREQMMMAQAGGLVPEGGGLGDSTQEPNPELAPPMPEGEGVEGIAPTSPPMPLLPQPMPEDLIEQRMQSFERLCQSLGTLMVKLIAETEESNRIAVADKIPIRDPGTGLIERVTVNIH